MINANNIIHDKSRYDRELTAERAKNILFHLNLEGTEKELESYFAALAACLDKAAFNDMELYDYCMDIRKLTEFRALMDKKLQVMMDHTLAGKYKEELEKYTEDHILPYYKFKFRINQSRQISFLPLPLRLLVYNTMLQQDEGGLTALNYLDRLEVTLSKSGEKDLASVIAGFKWVLNWGAIAGGNSDTVFKEDIKSIHELKVTRKNKLAQMGIKEEGYLEDVIYSLKNFASKENIHDMESAKLILPILKIYFKDFEGIDQYVDNIMEYLETGNEELVAILKKKKKK